MLPALNEHFSADVDSVYCENVDTSSCEELVILARVIRFKLSLGSAGECALVEIGAVSVAFNLFNLPILDIIHRDVLIESAVLWLLQGGMVSC